ncbi:MAG TPA: GatB/YqeY domain-containing protein [Bacilli bacterium]|nr:GatB/YqeY domain-containing protein [Bacilli bacterium]
MNIVDNLNKEITNAMKNRNTFTLSVLRMLKSALQMEKISKKRDLDEAEVIAVIKKQVKLRKESLSEYQKYDKLEQVTNLQEEIQILAKYLPTEMTEADIEKIIEQAFIELKPQGVKDIGLVMKFISPKLAGKADMKLVNELVRKRFN